MSDTVKLDRSQGSEKYFCNAIWWRFENRHAPNAVLRSLLSESKILLDAIVK
ncbi:hypothetical protein QWJ46_16320 [Rhizobium sp. CBN3]|uniref:hypothetical protein n=1 Tax=Rhizobium sp. CBN3 TaxID=3058045 RepID=UPI002670DEA3|nr:hypothetical protein [Rhizobium sp. CBN3]MDO3434249.1 hypothetical protein [Rhizobium sp. CBN3]